MKKIISILLSGLLIISSFLPFGNITELSKTPSMLSHFQKHKQRNNSITFWEFFTKHYRASINHEETEHGNDALPFHGSVIISVIFILPSVFNLLKHTLDYKTITYSIVDQDIYKHLFEFSFFHPPQIKL